VPWPFIGGVPSSEGWYLVTTTWREIIKHATEVGRDLTPWLSRFPQLAGQELLARVAPLQAYLSVLEGQPQPHRHSAGRRLVASVVHSHGAERSARGAFAYRLGMTMAQWACCGLMGLGRTTHVENGGPPGVPGFSDPAEARPDLWGKHLADGSPWWLIEAKAANKIGLVHLRKGAAQLSAGSHLMGHRPHRLLLCGTSLHDQVFMTIDDLPVSARPSSDADRTPLAPADGGPDAEDHLNSDDDVLLATARAQMLVYLSLRYTSRSALRLVPVSARRDAGLRVSTGSVIPLEADTATTEVRQRLHAQSPTEYQLLRDRPGVTDFVSCSIPGTGLHLGMTRHLYAACEQLFYEQARIADEIGDLAPGLVLRPGDLPGIGSAEDFEEVLGEQRSRYQEREYADYHQIRGAVRRAYHQASSMDWRQLLDGAQPRPVFDSEGLLEGATSQTYIALERTGFLPSVELVDADLL
jgi:hypothetical protein